VGHDPANRRFGVLDPGSDYARIGVETGVLVASQQMPAGRINAIGVNIGTVLLEDEDPLTQLEEIIEVIEPKLRIWIQVPAHRW
jgi:hypothetical protein